MCVKFRIFPFLELLFSKCSHHIDWVIVFKSILLMAILFKRQIQKINKINYHDYDCIIITGKLTDLQSGFNNKLAQELRPVFLWGFVNSITHFMSICIFINNLNCIDFRAKIIMGILGMHIFQTRHYSILRKNYLFRFYWQVLPFTFKWILLHKDLSYMIYSLNSLLSMRKLFYNSSGYVGYFYNWFNSWYKFGIYIILYHTAQMLMLSQFSHKMLL